MTVKKENPNVVKYFNSWIENDELYVVVYYKFNKLKFLYLFSKLILLYFQIKLLSK